MCLLSSSLCEMAYYVDLLANSHTLVLKLGMHYTQRCIPICLYLSEIMIPLLTSAYLAPVHYYTKLLAAPCVVEERAEHYVKQTFRNRCLIATADGVQALTIPVQGCKDLGGDHKTPTKAMRIIDSNRWRQLHWNALVSAYDRTPFFEYYADDFAVLYQTPYDKLVDFNADLQRLVLRLLDLHPTIVVNQEDYLMVDEQGCWLNPSASLQSAVAHTLQSESARTFQSASTLAFQCEGSEEVLSAPLRCQDFRETIRPKIDFHFDTSFSPQHYYQVFAAKHGFLPNLSIVDLLFNMGPESRVVLRASVVQ